MKTDLLFSRIAAGFAGVAAAAGLTVLVAGDSQARILTTSGAAVRPMEPWAAVDLLLLGFALGLLAIGRGAAWPRRLGTIVAGVALAASLTSMMLHFAGATPPAGSLLGMLYATRVLGGLVLTLAGAALLLISLGRLTTASGILGLVLVVIGGSMLIALAYGGPLFIQREFPMVGLPAAIATLCFGIAVILANGQAAWPVKYFVGPSVSALLLRYLLPVFALAVLFTDAASNLFFSEFSPAIGSTLNTIISILLASVVIVGLGRVIGKRLDRSYAAVAASEDKFRRVFKALPAGLAVSRLNDGRFVDVNDEFVKAYGFSKEEVLGRTSTELGMWNRAEDRDAVVQGLRASGNQRDVEMNMKAKGGRDVTLRTSIHVLDLDGEPSMISTFIDVTEKKKLEAARVRADAQLAAIFRESPVPLSVTNVETGKLVSVNPAFLEAYGATSEEQVLGKSRGELRIWGPEVRQTIVDLLRQGKRAQGVFPVRRLDGEMRMFQVSAAVYTLDGEQFSLGASMHITDRLRLEEEREKAQKQYQELFSGVRDVVFSLSTDGVITVLNPAFETVTGMPTGDWIGKVFLELVHPDDAERAMRALRQSLAGQPKDDAAIRIKTSTGYRFAEIISAPHVEEGRIVGILGIGRDVSDRIALEDQLRQSQKMEAMGSLAGGIAHDFNNLLTVIIGFGQLSLSNAGASKEIKEDITEMVNAAGRAAEMTRQLLAFSRKQVREPRDVNINSILDGVEKMLRRMIGEHVILKSDHAEDLGIIRADPGQLEQVVANLCVNARDAMPNGGTVTVSTANVTLDEAFAARHTGASAGAFVRLSVADTGTGMSPEIRARIFEPFFTTKEVGKGTGLGLSTVFGIVQQSQGFVVVDSEVGRGTTFELYFPRTEARRASLPEAMKVAGSNDGTETILLAEDNPPLRSLAVRTLRERGYTVLAAAGGEEALLLAERHEGSIDLLITDVVMPGMSGRALAEGLGRARPGIRVLYASGYSDDILGQQGVLDADVMLLAKPFTPDALAAKVRSVLDRSPVPTIA